MSDFYTVQMSNEWRLEAPENSKLFKSHITKRKKILQKVFPCFKNQTLPCRHHVCFTEGLILGLIPVSEIRLMFTPINPNTAKQDIRGYANAPSVDSNVVLEKVFPVLCFCAEHYKYL